MNKIQVKTFISPKSNRKKMRSCGDRLAINLPAAQFAISDGVSKSYLSSIWADLLVSDYVNSSLSDKILFRDLLKEHVQELGQKWKEKAEIYESSVDEYAKELLKISKHKYSYAAATFAGIKIIDNTLFYEVIGDSCIFLLSNEGNLKSLSTNSISKFDTYPDYITSKATLRGKWLSGGEKLNSGYVFMMTDALSEWFISQQKIDIQFADKLWQLHSHAEFEYMLQMERSRFVDDKKQYALKNDDCTLVMLKVPATYSGMELVHHDDLTSFIIAEEDEKMPELHPIMKKSEPDGSHSPFIPPITSTLFLPLLRPNSHINTQRKRFSFKALFYKIWSKILGYVI